MPKKISPPQVSSCCKAEIRHSDDGYGNKKPFCNACLLNIAPKKRVKKESEWRCGKCDGGDFPLHSLHCKKRVNATASTSRPCPEDCKGDEKHLHVAYTGGEETSDQWRKRIREEANEKIATTCMKEHSTPTWQIWFRRIMLVVLGGLIVLAWQKFSYNATYTAAHQAIYDILFLQK